MFSHTKQAPELSAALLAFSKLPEENGFYKLFKIFIITKWEECVAQRKPKGMQIGAPLELIEQLPMEVWEEAVAYLLATKGRARFDIGLIANRVYEYSPDDDYNERSDERYAFHEHVDQNEEKQCDRLFKSKAYVMNVLECDEFVKVD